MKKILLLVFVILMVEGCNKCQDDPNLNSEELSWMPYHGGETLIFKSASGAYDTLKVGQKTIFVHSGYDAELEDHNKCTYTTQELRVPIGSYTFSISHANIYASSISTMHWDGAGKGNVPMINTQVINQNPPQNNIVLNGRTFNNVYNLGYLYYTKQDGIVAFKGTTNDTLLYVKIN